jgi:phosphohistidine phosphatase SixA
MICGHDPTLTDFVNDFLRIPLNKIQTSAVMKIQFHSDSWSQIQFADVEQLIYFNRQETKELKYAKTSS